MNSGFLIVGILATLLPLQSVYAQQAYSYATIDYPDASPSTVLTGIDSAGDVVGFAFISVKEGGQQTQPFIRLANGSFKALPFTGPKTLCEPDGISDSGTVVGFCNTDGVIYTEHTFELFSLGPRQTELTGISTNGLKVGNQFGTSVSYAFQLRGGRVEALPLLYGMAVQASGINSLGTIVGTAPTETGASVTGFTLTPGGNYQTAAYPGATYTYFSAINDYGLVAGYWVSGLVAQSFTYFDGQFTPVQFPGAVSTQAFGINNSGVVSGTYLDAGATNHGFIAIPLK